MFAASDTHYASAHDSLQQLHSDIESLLSKPPECRGVLGAHALLSEQCEADLSELADAARADVAETARALQQRVQELSERCRQIIKQMGLQEVLRL